jgi:integrase
MGTVIDFTTWRDARQVESACAGNDGLAQVIVAMIEELRLRSRAEATIDQYEYELGRYERHLAAQQLDWLLITPQQMSAYARTRADLSFSSRAALITIMRRFYAFAVEEGHLTASPAAHLQTPPRPKPVPRALSMEQIRKLVTECLRQLREGTRSEQRDAVLMLMGLYHGLRASELARLVWGQLDLGERSLTIPLSKMARGRTLTVHSELLPALRQWRAAQGLDGDDTVPVFRLKGDGPLHPERVGKIARDYAERLDIPLTAHVLRHSFATWALRKSRDIYAVSKALGHGQLQQTEIYLRSDPSDSAPAVNALPAPSDW